MKIMVNSTPLALWQDVVHEAGLTCATTLAEELESYLVFLLMRYLDKPEVIKKVMAIEFLHGTQLTGNKQKERLLQAVGDECLLFSGLFPELAVKRQVKIAYYVTIGQSAYYSVSKHSNDLYGLLSQHFVSLMDVLQTLRQYAANYPNLLPLEAYDLWNQTGSQRALAMLKQYTQSTPLNCPEIELPIPLLKRK